MSLIDYLCIHSSYLDDIMSPTNYLRIYSSYLDDIMSFIDNDSNDHD